MNLPSIITSKLLSVLLIALCFSFIITFVTGNSTECLQVGCGCQFTNASGTYEISMKGLLKPGDYYNVFKGITPWAYYINPCYEFTLNAECKDVTMCLRNGGEGIPIANYEIKDFSPFVNRDTPLKVTYRELQQGGRVSRQMIINLKYDTLPEPPQKVTEGSGTNPLTYTLEIKSPLFRPQKVQPSSGGGSSSALSTGSVIVIIFFVVVVIYLVAGILFMKYKRGATGKEVIPNVEFWSSFPGLIKDGCVFFGKKMKELCFRCYKRQGYSEI